MTNIANAEISTLFTTPQERLLINTNRYKSDQIMAKEPQQEGPVVEGIQQLVMEEVKETFTISGITLSGSGPHMIWINNQVYEDGEKMENKSRIEVLSGDDIKVRITAPDGKHYYGSSGETIEVVYQAAAEN